jgi:glycosyltransferase involved in cell wall biosynthesis
MKPVKVSVLMLTYNRPLKIGRAIASVIDQSFPDWELIVVQDGSHAQTAQIVSEWTAKDSRIRYFARGTVGSIAEASNFGLKQARGEYIAILDDDDYWSAPDKLESQVEFLDCIPSYVACGGGYILINQDGIERGTFFKPESDDDIRSGALLANPIANSTAMFRRIIGGRPALYDESMHGYADWDFWLSVGTAGKLYNSPRVLAHYALWEGGGSFRQHKINARSGVAIVGKHHRHYRGVAAALPLAWAQYAYACLPEGIRRFSYCTLSSLKKSLAAAQTPAGLLTGRARSSRVTGHNT